MPIYSSGDAPLRLLLFSILSIAFLFSGCGSGVVSVKAPSETLPSPPPPPSTPSSKYSEYHAYGDSITAGAGLSLPTKQAYPALVAIDRNLTLSNYAISRDQACDVPTRQIFAHEDSPSLISPSLYSLLVGTNDVDIRGIGPYEVTFSLCHQAAIAWLAVPAEFKVFPGSNNVTTMGGGSLDTSNHWNAWITAAQGASISFIITTQQTGPIYAWPRIDDTNPGTYTYSLDNIVVGTGHTRTTPAIATANGTTNSLGFLRLPAVPSGRHIVTFTQTSTGQNGVSIAAIGAPPGTKLDTLPTVLVGTIPFQLHEVGSSYPCTSTDAPCREYNQNIESTVALFAGDGLDVRLFDTHKYMFGASTEMLDELHPNPLGHIELSHAVEASF
jgi:lysophospholipase L1-like esterase